jgi:ABC-2 type transport system permease protein
MTDPSAPSFRSAVALVARREIVERARERSFLVSTFFTLLLVVGVVVVPPLLGFGDPPSYRVTFAGPAAQRYAASAQALAEQLDVDLDVDLDTDPEPVAAPPERLRDRVRGGELDAVVTAAAVVVREELDGPLGTVLQGAGRAVRAEDRLAAAGVDPRAVAAAQDVPPLAVEVTDPPDPDADAREGIAFVGTFVLYGQLLGYGFWVALGVVEEKASRVVEVLLATVRPRALLAGKVLGIGVLGLAQLLLVGAVGLGVAQAVGAVDVGAEALTPAAMVLGWFVLGFAFYACLFAAGAARVSRQEDLQSVTTPGTMLVLASFFAAFAAGSSPDSTLARVLSVAPPFSALVSPVRTASGGVPAWEVLLALVLMLVAVAGLVVVAARLYEGAILRMGATVSLREAWRRRGHRVPGDRPVA